ncbi:unnamed protein product [Protopolystoma xenopodis]|uniref:BK channel n=1 Tax=Protopolystoma xenopodis TaxID=117903 RepID=A0A448X7F1_9PLAT|nr:unnamed protein product [Protopolystoma xenopodis]
MDELVWPTEWKDLATELISGQRRTGRVLVTFIFSLTIASYGLYIVDANRVKADPLTGGMELCIAFRDSFVQQVDLVFNLFFIGHFVLRLIASSDKLWYWFDIFTLVDLFTIPPAFVGLYFRRVWIGLRFTRILRLLTLADVLQYLNILKTGNTIRLCQLVTMFASLVLTAAGFIHLVENSGDPPEFKNANAITYFECTYMMIVTITTVGFGDLTAQTTSGRVFMILFLLSGLAVFANSVPEIADIVGSRNKYGGVYRKTTGKSHLVLCGHITFSTVNNFLSDFLHEDREDVDTQIVILHKSVPDLELEGTLKRHGTQVFYFQASKHLLFLKL